MVHSNVTKIRQKSKRMWGHCTHSSLLTAVGATAPRTHSGRPCITAAAHLPPMTGADRPIMMYYSIWLSLVRVNIDSAVDVQPH